MTKLNIENQIIELTDKLNGLCEAYHNQAMSPVTDETYDRMYRELLELEKTHPEFKQPDSPTGRVGFAPKSVQSINSHLQPILSLGNIFNYDELLGFLVTTKGSLVSAEYKMDGLALILTYVNRKLDRISTRGDGFSGEDITFVASHIPTIPHQLDICYPSDIYEIHGEAYLPIAAFEEINKRRESIGMQPYSNPRNTVAGMLRRKDYNRDIFEVEFTPYGCSQNLIDLLRVKTYCDLLHFFRRNFRCVTETKMFESIDELQNYYNDIMLRKRSTLPFEIDGLVIKVVNMSKRLEMGTTTREPNWATAYKFTAQTTTPILSDIEWGLSRTGLLIPVAILNPVNIGGVTITRCSLHNLNNIRKLDLKIGDKVTLIRSGDVIPKIISGEHTSESTDIIFPTKCPECTTEVTPAEKTGELQCTNPECTGKIVGSILSFCSRKYMDIKGIGEAFIRLMVETGYLKSYADLYHLDKYRDEIIKDGGVSSKVLDKILAVIDGRRNVSFATFLGSLGIQGFGRTLAPSVATQFESIESMFSMEEEELRKRLSKVDGLGSVLIDKIVDYIKNYSSLYSHAKAGGLNLS